MSNNRTSFKDWFERLLLQLIFRKYFVFQKVKVEVKDFESDGLTLDIGGGGEGVIGRLKGPQAIAIDLRQDELDEAPDGPQKIVMDARELTFPDDHFGTVTAFFSMMYMKTREDHQKVMKEAFRVLKPGGHMYLWEIDLSTRTSSKKKAYIVPVRYQVGQFKKGTAYGVSLPAEVRDEAYYLELAQEAGFKHISTERIGQAFQFSFTK